MKLVFCGTPEFAVPTLAAVLAAGHEVALVVTQPDRAAGRGMEMKVPPVKSFALERGLPILQPEKIKNNEEFRTLLEAIQPDAILVVAYGRIIPDWMLALPRYGNINLHGSLLPKLRGAAPIQWAVANGEAVTGVTTMLLERGLDTGPMLLAQAVAIGQEETAEDVFESLAAIGAPLMVQTLEGLESGSVQARAQDHAQATLAPILTREDGRIDFMRPAQEVCDRWRGFQPWPGAHTTLRGKKLIVNRMRRHKVHVEETRVDRVEVIEPAEVAGEPGTIVLRRSDRGEELLAVCADQTAVVFDEVQVEGKKRMPTAEFLKGFQVRSGERLGA